MLEALCRLSSTTLDTMHAEDGPPITQRTSGLVLLRHNFRCLLCAEIGPTQQGHRDSVATSATINLRRIVAMEFGMWRSGRNGGPSGPISFGNCNFREQPGGTSS